MIRFRNKTSFDGLSLQLKYANNEYFISVRFMLVFFYYASMLDKILCVIDLY